MKKLCTLALFLLLLTSTNLRAGEDYGWRVAGTAVDIFIARPFTFVASLLGGVVWTVALPITVPTKTTGDSFDALVRHPWNLTFDRELGDYGED